MLAILSDGTSVWTVAGGILLAVMILAILGVVTFAVYILVLYRTTRIKVPNGVVYVHEAKYVDIKTIYMFDMFKAVRAGRWSPVLYDAWRAQNVPDIVEVYRSVSHPDQLQNASNTNRDTYVRVDEYEAWVKDPSMDKEPHTLNLPTEFVVSSN